MVINGPYGSGKTHLAAAIGHHYQSLNREALFVTVPDLLDHLRLTYAPDSPRTFDYLFQAVRNVSLLILDDLGTENATPWAKEKLFQILDHRYVGEHPTVITTALPLETVDKRIASRLLDRRRCTRFTTKVGEYSLRLNRRNE